MIKININTTCSYCHIGEYFRNQINVANHKRIRVIFSVTATILLLGCSTMRYGGAPEPSFDTDKDLEELAAQFNPAASIAEFYRSPSDAARNKFIIGRITITTLRTVFENNRRGTLNPEENVVSDTPPPPKLRFPCRY